MERAATYNLAEDRLWQGALDEASLLAGRSLALQRDQAEGVPTVDQLLVARIQAMQGSPPSSRCDARARSRGLELSVADRELVDVLSAMRRAHRGRTGSGW